MNEELFNTLFDRPIHNPDFLRARVASCIPAISDETNKLNTGDYYKAFYEATTKYNEQIIKEFGLDYLEKTKEKIIDFSIFLTNLNNSDDIYDFITKNNFKNKFVYFNNFAKYTGYTKRSRILKRYKNFTKISTMFIKNKGLIKYYEKEIKFHLEFFQKMCQYISNVPLDELCIYYFVYDIRASENVRALKHIRKKLKLK